MVDLQDAAARMYAAKKFRNASKGITAGAADFDLKEDAPMNATGGAISMPPTMQKKKKRMSNKNFEVLKRKI